MRVIRNSITIGIGGQFFTMPCSSALVDLVLATLLGSWQARACGGVAQGGLRSGQRRLVVRRTLMHDLGGAACQGGQTLVSKAESRHVRELRLAEGSEVRAQFHDHAIILGVI